MVHSGYEASAVDHTFQSLKGLLATARASLFGGRYANQAALEALSEPAQTHSGKLVQLQVSARGTPQRDEVSV